MKPFLSIYIAKSAPLNGYPYLEELVSSFQLGIPFAIKKENLQA